VDRAEREAVHVHFELRKESINGGTILHGKFRLGILLFAETKNSLKLYILQPCPVDSKYYYNISCL